MRLFASRSGGRPVLWIGHEHGGDGRPPSGRVEGARLPQLRPAAGPGSTTSPRAVPPNGPPTGSPPRPRGSPAGRRGPGASFGRGLRWKIWRSTWPSRPPGLTARLCGSGRTAACGVGREGPVDGHRELASGLPGMRRCSRWSKAGRRPARSSGSAPAPAWCAVPRADAKSSIPKIPPCRTAGSTPSWRPRKLKGLFSGSAPGTAGWCAGAPGRPDDDLQHPDLAVAAQLDQRPPRGPVRRRAVSLDRHQRRSGPSRSLRR